MTENYIGRFAPSPSGPLHFGSLVTALASFLQARTQNGRWLLRIDDIDPPREQAGAADNIQACLVAHGLTWDGPVIFQSEQSDNYREALETLAEKDLTYNCRCTRKAIRMRSEYYDQYCRTLSYPDEDSAVRFKNDPPRLSLVDQLQSQITLNPLAICEDFVVRRKDGLFGYHLASVVDDIRLGVNEIVRGADLLEPTACQLSLFSAFNAPIPQFVHLPVAATAVGQKLSKQNHAPAINNADASNNLFEVLRYLGQKPPEALKHRATQEVIDWALTHWQLSLVPATTEIITTTP